MSYRSHDERRIEKLLREIDRKVDRIERELAPHPTHIYSNFGGNMVDFIVGQTATETITETNPQGPFPVVGADITFVSSDPTIASVVNNGDGTALWTALAPGSVTVTYTDTKYNLTGTDTLTVTLAPPTAIANTFSTPA